MRNNNLFACTKCGTLSRTKTSYCTLCGGSVLESTLVGTRNCESRLCLTRLIDSDIYCPNCGRRATQIPCIARQYTHETEDID